MSPRLTLATARRVLTQVRHDRRTVALVIVAPLLVLTLFHYLYDGKEPFVSRLELQMLTVFPMFVMFLLTAIATVRERTSGTLERLFTTPLGKGDFMAGYALAYGLLGAVQASLAAAWCWWVLRMDVPASYWLVLATAVVAALLGLSMGLLASAASRTEFQAVQFMPLLIVPQMLLCGLLQPRDKMAEWLRWISDALPLSYAMDATKELTLHADATAAWWRGIGITVAFVVVLLALASATLRRRTA